MTYYPKIDGLRFIAIAAVMVHHIANIFSTFIDWGYFGVDLFFVISGFLITSILLKSTGTFKSTYGNFLARRSLRIFPLYYFTLTILILIGHPVVWGEMGYLLTYTFNYRFPHIELANPVGHFWSLSVEEQFYLFWPFMVLGFKNRPKLLITITSLMIGFAYLQIYFHLIPTISMYNYTGLPTRMGSLGLGALGATLYANPSEGFKRLLYNAYIEIVMLILWAWSLYSFSPFFLGLASLFMVLKAAEDSFFIKPLGKLLCHPHVIYIGRISYGLYVYHVIIIYYATPYVFDPLWDSIDFASWGRLSILQYHSWLVKLPVYSLMTVLTAALSYQYFERPFLNLKDRFFRYTKTSSSAT